MAETNRTNIWFHLDIWDKTVLLKQMISHAITRESMSLTNWVPNWNWQLVFPDWAVSEMNLFLLQVMMAIIFWVLSARQYVSRIDSFYFVRRFVRLGKKGHGTPYGWVKSDLSEESRVLGKCQREVGLSAYQRFGLSAIGAYTYTNGESPYLSGYHEAERRTPIGSFESDSWYGKDYLSEFFQSTADYNKTFGKHSIGVLAGYSWEQEDYRGLTGYRDNFPTMICHIWMLVHRIISSHQEAATSWAFAVLQKRGRANIILISVICLNQLFVMMVHHAFQKTKIRILSFCSSLDGDCQRKKFIKENEKLGFIDNPEAKSFMGTSG